MQRQLVQTEDSNAMTLQVGLVGSDGLVLASDRLLQQTDGAGGRSVSYTSKFLQGDGVLCCWSGDSVSEWAANSIRTSQFPRSCLRPRHRQAAKACSGRIDNLCLDAFRSWRLGALRCERASRRQLHQPRHRTRTRLIGERLQALLRWIPYLANVFGGFRSPSELEESIIGHWHSIDVNIANSARYDFLLHAMTA